MTDIVLLDQLKEYVEEQTKDIILPVRPIKQKTTEEYRKEQQKQGKLVERRAPEVFMQGLPDKEAAENRLPFILLQLVTGIDEQNAGEDSDSECKVRLIVGVYNEDGSEGSMSLLNIITRLRVDLLREQQVGQFLLRMPLERYIYPDDLGSYYYGELLLTFEMPEINRDIEYY